MRTIIKMNKYLDLAMCYSIISPGRLAARRKGGRRWLNPGQVRHSKAFLYSFSGKKVLCIINILD
jgi:hypothetical protein